MKPHRDPNGPRSRRGPASGLRLVFLAALLSCAPLLVTAGGRTRLVDSPLARGLDERERIALEAIALQPENLHATLLAVIERGEILVQLPAIWNDFDLAVQTAVGERSPERRSALREVLRRPDLLSQLLAEADAAESGPQGRRDREPDPVRDLAREDRSLLRRLERELRRASERFEGLIAALTPAQREAFREFVGHPELAALLLENIRVSESLAGAWRVDPAATLAQLHELARRARDARERRAQDERRQREAARLAAEKRERERAERRERERSRHRYGNRAWDTACWYGHPRYSHDWIRHRAYGRHCWYPWYRYGRW